MRSAGKTDKEIIAQLGLEGKTEFKQDRAYLKPLIGFVTSRRATDEKTNIALAYQYNNGKTQTGAKNTDEKQRSLTDF